MLLKMKSLSSEDKLIDVCMELHKIHFEGVNYIVDEGISGYLRYLSGSFRSYNSVLPSLCSKIDFVIRD